MCDVHSNAVWYVIMLLSFLFWKKEINGGDVRPVLNLLETSEQPPTYNRVNKFTAVFQGIVDSYGIANYLELNPGKCEYRISSYHIISLAPYTIITFPFLFSCMFGDFGHGMIMFCAALFLVLREKNLIERKIRDEVRIWSTYLNNVTYIDIWNVLRRTIYHLVDGSILDVRRHYL